MSLGIGSHRRLWDPGLLPVSVLCLHPISGQNYKGKERDIDTQQERRLILNEFMCRAPKMLEKNADPERRYTCVVIITVITHCYWILGPQSDVIGRW